MRRLLDLWYAVLRVALTLLMAALVVPVTMQVLSRYGGIIPRYLWTEEVARFCFVWIILIGAMIAVRDGTHFDVDLLPQPREPRRAALLRLLVHLAVGVVGVIFVVYGWRFVQFGWNQTSEIAELPMIWMFVAFPLAGITWLAFLAEKIIDELRTIRQPEG